MWLNGNPLPAEATQAGKTTFVADVATVYADDANLIVIRHDRSDGVSLNGAPVMRANNESLHLNGQWQLRVGDDPSFSNIPLPAKFGTSADVVFSPPRPLWMAEPATHTGMFTPGIEGPACDHDGNIYAVNFKQQGTIGVVTPNGVGSVFVQLPKASIGNGIRFDAAGEHFFVADYTMHNVLRVNLHSKQIETFAHNANMNQPNDLAIAPNGTLFASDPNWSNSTGQLWRIDTDGSVSKLANDMGTTNGIEVSPDGKHLYVNESVQRNIWRFDIQADGSLANKSLFKAFPDFGFDGMRCDVDGNLYVTRYGKGTVVKLTPEGEAIQEIDVLGSRPSNLCFGGPDGCTVYVTEVDYTRLVSFRVDKPGRAWAERKIDTAQTPTSDSSQ